MTMMQIAGRRSLLSKQPEQHAGGFLLASTALHLGKASPDGNDQAEPGVSEQEQSAILAKDSSAFGQSLEAKFLPEGHKQDNAVSPGAARQGPANWEVGDLLGLGGGLEQISGRPHLPSSPFLTSSDPGAHHQYSSSSIAYVLYKGI